MSKVLKVFIGLIVAALIGLVINGCSDYKSTGPGGLPKEVIAAAAPNTEKAGTARVDVVSQQQNLYGTIDFRNSKIVLKIKDRSEGTASVTSSKVEFSCEGEPCTSLSSLFSGRIPIKDPASILDLLSGVSKIDPYGGVEIEGESTVRYSLIIDRQKIKGDLVAFTGGWARRFPIEVWIDSEGRIRRLQFSSNLKSTTTTATESGVALNVVTVDFFDYGVPFPNSTTTTTAITND